MLQVAPLKAATTPSSYTRHGGNQDLDANALLPFFAIITEPTQVVLVRHDALMNEGAGDDALLATQVQVPDEDCTMRPTVDEVLATLLFPQGIIPRAEAWDKIISAHALLQRLRRPYDECARCVHNRTVGATGAAGAAAAAAANAASAAAAAAATAAAADGAGAAAAVAATASAAADLLLGCRCRKQTNWRKQPSMRWLAMRLPAASRNHGSAIWK